MPDEILKVERKRAKNLVDAGPQESFGNKEEERLQCLRCQGDETSCGTVMLVRTSFKAAEPRGDQAGENNAADSTKNDMVVFDPAVSNTLVSSPVGNGF